MKNRNRNMGSALIITLFVIIIMVAFAGSYVAVTAKHSQASDYNLETTMSFYAAESGLDACLSSLNNSGTGIVLGDLPGVSGTGMSFSMTNQQADGIDNDNNGIVDDADEAGNYSGAWYQSRPTAVPQFFPWGNDNLDNDGDAEIDEADEKDTYVGKLYSAGSAGGHVTTIAAEVIATRSSAFAMAMFGDDFVTIAGANAMTDSYNSGKGSYVDQLTTWGDNGRDDDGDGVLDEQDETTHANGMGDVGTNGIITLNGQPIVFGDVAYFEGLDLGSGAIYGNIGQMPTEIALDAIPQSEIDNAMINNNNANIMSVMERDVVIEKQVPTEQEVWVWEDFNCGAPGCPKCRDGALGCKRKVLKTIIIMETIFETVKEVVSAPIVPAPTNLNVAPNESVSLPPGTYYFDSIDVKGDVHIGDGVTIYCTGDVSFQTSSKVFNTGRKPTDLTLLCTGENIKLNANVDFYGAIYAPNAAIDITSNFTDLYGSIVGKSIRMMGNAAFHYDEALGEKGWSPRFLWAIKSWELKESFSAEGRQGNMSYDDYYEID
ncbi:MAG: hypothetical protein RDV41_11715 [Planctomycetota bacterium]|nr:hypothetical protein [Planctomycetota bacterium]